MASKLKETDDVNEDFFINALTSHLTSPIGRICLLSWVIDVWRHPCLTCVDDKMRYSWQRRSRRLDPSQPHPEMFIVKALEKILADREIKRAYNAQLRKACEEALGM